MQYEVVARSDSVAVTREGDTIAEFYRRPFNDDRALSLAVTVAEMLNGILPWPVKVLPDPGNGPFYVPD